MKDPVGLMRPVRPAMEQAVGRVWWVVGEDGDEDGDGRDGLVWASTGYVDEGRADVAGRPRDVEVGERR